MFLTLCLPPIPTQEMSEWQSERVPIQHRFRYAAINPVCTPPKYDGSLKRPGLIFKEGKVGCSIRKQCGSFKRVHTSGADVNVSHHWANVTVEANGIDAKAEQSSLRKKLKLNFDSRAYFKATEMINSGRPLDKDID